MISFGPAGLGGIKEAEANLEEYAKLGLKACEIAFTYGIYIHNKEDAVRIGNKASKLEIRLSIHAPYWINLNSQEKLKIEQSKKRILDCCRVGELLQAEYVVFHPGFYGKTSQEQTYENIKNELLELQKEIKKQAWKIKLAPETTGKVNVFGKEEEILALVKDTGCFFTIDFSHLLARSQGKMTYDEMYEKVKNFSSLHCHFSGIDFGEKGERNHKLTPEAEIKKLLEILPKNKDILIINESPSPVEDSVKMLEIYEKL
ncbi:MAG: TIM barrel protein [Candidatus Pacearchaeota archaeon]|nr:TIM barrel protein [Candidatus Pacearchaeota archaeon]